MLNWRLYWKIKIIFSQKCLFFIICTRFGAIQPNYILYIKRNGFVKTHQAFYFIKHKICWKISTALHQIYLELPLVWWKYVLAALTRDVTFIFWHYMFMDHKTYLCQRCNKQHRDIKHNSQLFMTFFWRRYSSIAIIYYYY